MAEHPTDVVVALSYYWPYVSGLSDTARHVAEGLARGGWSVAVVTSQHDAALPREEEVGGVMVHRCPVVARLGKGVVSPSYPATVRRLARSAQVLHLHLPMLEASLLAVSQPTSTVVTYHCDVALDRSFVGRTQQRTIDASSRVALRRAARTIVTSHDYASASRLSAMLGDATAIPPTCLARAGGQPAFRETDGPHIGFLGRIVEEKGLEHLVAGFRGIDDPDARLLVAGDFSAVAGGSVVDRVRAAIGEDSRVRLLGFVPDDALPDLYASMDVFALPSVNSFEAFGIVQVEAMMAGVPVLASDLPGVRTVVQDTGFGEIVPPCDPVAITNALRRILATPFDRSRLAAEVAERYSLERTVSAYDAVLRELGAIPTGSPVP